MNCSHFSASKMRMSNVILLIILCVHVTLRETGAAIDFDKEIKPILAERCLECHGEEEQNSGIRLDQRPIMLRGGDSGIGESMP